MCKLPVIFLMCSALVVSGCGPETAALGNVSLESKPSLSAPNAASTQSAMSAAMAQSMEHEHTMIQIPDGVPLPRLSTALSKDAKSGFNVTIQVQNFEMEPPEAADSQQAVLEGHAHVYINGEKAYRAYGTHLHLPATLFKPGVNQVMVSLNDHDHNTWTKGSKMVMSTVVIDTESKEFIKHQFSSFALLLPDRS